MVLLRSTLDWSSARIRGLSPSAEGSQMSGFAMHEPHVFDSAPPLRPIGAPTPYSAKSASKFGVNFAGGTIGTYLLSSQVGLYVAGVSDGAPTASPVRRLAHLTRSGVDNSLPGVGHKP